MLAHLIEVTQWTDEMKSEIHNYYLHLEVCAVANPWQVLSSMNVLKTLFYVLKLTSSLKIGNTDVP